MDGAEANFVYLRGNEHFISLYWTYILPYQSKQKGAPQKSKTYNFGGKKSDVQVDK